MRLELMAEIQVDADDRPTVAGASAGRAEVWRMGFAALYPSYARGDVVALHARGYRTQSRVYSGPVWP